MSYLPEHSTTHQLVESCLEATAQFNAEKDALEKSMVNQASDIKCLDKAIRSLDAVIMEQTPLSREMAKQIKEMKEEQTKNRMEINTLRCALDHFRDEQRGVNNSNAEASTLRGQLVCGLEKVVKAMGNNLENTTTKYDAAIEAGRTSKQAMLDRIANMETKKNAIDAIALELKQHKDSAAVINARRDEMHHSHNALLTTVHCKLQNTEKIATELETYCKSRLCNLEQQVRLIKERPEPKKKLSKKEKAARFDKLTASPGCLCFACERINESKQ